MSIVNIRNIEITNNPAKFSDSYNFKIQFECIAPLKEDLEWKLIYVGSAESEKYDQELDSCMVGPVPVGINSFEFTASAPSAHLLPSSDILGLTVIILTASYNDKEFVRVGYYVNTEYEEEEMRENPPAEIVLDKLIRNVLVEKPRVTRFSNKWDDSSEPPATTTESDVLYDGDMVNGGDGEDVIPAAPAPLAAVAQPEPKESSTEEVPAAAEEEKKEDVAAPVAISA